MFAALRQSGAGPTLPTCALQEVGSYRGYTDRQRPGPVRGEDDPKYDMEPLAPDQGSKHLNPLDRLETRGGPILCWLFEAFSFQ
jgi:hypothetical protein